MNRFLYSAGLCVAMMLAGCADDRFASPERDSSGLGTINMSSQRVQEATTRVNDEGFADGDVMGVYIEEGWMCR